MYSIGQYGKVSQKYQKSMTGLLSLITPIGGQKNKGHLQS